MLRLKTLFGETYVELTPGHKDSGRLPDGGHLADAQIAKSVELDEVLKTFKPKTRAAFRTWVQSQADALNGRGGDINASFGSLPGFVDSADNLLVTLDAQSAAVRRLVRATGDFFGAISEREATLTLPELTAFGKQARPVVQRLQPVATAAEPVFRDFNQLAPQFDGFFERLELVNAAAIRGLPAFDRILDDLPGLFEQFQPVLRNVNPFVGYIGQHRREVTAFFANIAAATQARDMTPASLHILRTSQTLGPEAASVYPRPLASTRVNPYQAPGAMTKLKTGLPVLDKNVCGATEVLPPGVFGDDSLSNLITKYGFRTEGRDAVAPPCTPAGDFPGYGTQYPQVTAEP
jgi:ABC-type transporter Mla subunit MlaD